MQCEASISAALRHVLPSALPGRMASLSADALHKLFLRAQAWSVSVIVMRLGVP